MIDFFDIFSSKAKIKILRTLYYQECAISLRQIAYISELPVFSIQNALKDLLREKIIKKRKKGNRLMIQINKESEYYNFLKELFCIEEKSRIAAEAKQFDQKAKNVLMFANSANNFFERVKGSSKKVL